MRHRVGSLVLVLALAFLGAPRGTAAQAPGEVHRIGWLGSGLHAEFFRDVFLQGLGDHGLHEAQHFVFEHRVLAKGDFDFTRLPALAAELVAARPDVIVAVLTVSARAAKAATPTIPIVFAVVSDPVGDGLVESFARPGGNVTGVSADVVELSGKIAELLAEAVPGISRVAYLWNAALGPVARRGFEATAGAARTLGVAVESVEVRRDEDIAPALEAIARGRYDALIVLGEPLTGRHRTRIVEFALAHRLPLMAHGPRQWPEAGALMSYAPVYPAQFRRAGQLVARILRGAEPADLPVEISREYELAVNLKTAKALGLTIPPSVLVRADTVIE